jgi:hypothetical protein
LARGANCHARRKTERRDGNGAFTPRHVVGNTADFIPQYFNLRSEFTPTGGPTQTGASRPPRPIRMAIS